MLRRFSVNFFVFSISLDVSILSAALWLAGHALPSLDIFHQAGMVEDRLPLSLFFWVPVAWMGTFLAISLYDGRRNLRFVYEFLWLALGVTIAATVVAGLLYFTATVFPRPQFVLFIALAFLMMLGWRMAIRAYWRLNPGQSEFHRRFVVAGAGSVGQSIARQVIQNAPHGYTLVGYLDDDPATHTSPQVLGSLELLQQVVDQNKVDDVILALPSSAYQRTAWAVTQLQTLPVRVWIIPDEFRLSLYRTMIDEIAGIPLLDVRAPALDEYQRFMKRVLDLSTASLTLFFLWPLMGLIALLVRLDSPGPVIYRSRRAGENGREFEMLKFRTMRQDADQLLHQVTKPNIHGKMVHKRPEDPRVTRLGRFLRRYSLDELPQLINVLRGEMSMVGPRPELPHLVNEYEPWQRVRFTVPQGITGWWQVNGRSDRPMHLNTEDDLYYVRNYSIWLDMAIMMRTVLVVLFGRGAY